MKNKIVKLAGEKDEVLFENAQLALVKCWKLFFGKRQPSV